MKKVDRFFDRCSTAFNWVCIVFLAIMVIVVFINAIIRYFFRSAIAETEELARYMFIWVAFLGSAVAYQRKEHMFVPLFRDLLPQKIRQVAMLIAEVVTTLGIIFLLYSSTHYFIQSTEVTSSTMMINFGYFVVIVMPIMCIYMLLFDLKRVITFFLERKERKDNGEV